MRELTLILDELRGGLVVEDNEDLKSKVLEDLKSYLGESQPIACARPLEIIKPPVSLDKESVESTSIRIAGYYHNSLTEGPGRRSSVLFQYCPLKCPGCYVPELHSREGGTFISVKELVALLLDANFERDGVTILGGEPFEQTTGLLALVRELRLLNCPHLVCYSGYTFETLLKKAEKNPKISEILETIDLLIDGPFVQALAGGAGLWTGSSNQRVIDLAAGRKN